MASIENILQNSLPLAETTWSLTANLNVLASTKQGQHQPAAVLLQIHPSQLRVKESFGGPQPANGGGGGEEGRVVTLCELESDYSNASMAVVAVRSGGGCQSSSDVDETKLLASLKHANIVKLLGVVTTSPTTNSRPCTVLEHSNQG